VILTLVLTPSLAVALTCHEVLRQHDATTSCARSEQQATAHHTVAGEVGGVVFGEGEATSGEEEGEAHLTNDDNGVGLC
jgi:hypothetical protein